MLSGKMNKIKEIQRKYKLTDQELADELHLSRVHLNRLKNGHCDIMPQTDIILDIILEKLTINPHEVDNNC